MKAETTVSDWYLVREYVKLKNEEAYKQRKPEHYYLAQIAREVCCVLMDAKERKRISLNDFLLNFKTETKKSAKRNTPLARPRGKKKLTEEEKKRQATLNSKAAWFVALGITEKVTYGKENSPRGTGSPGNG